MPDEPTSPSKRAEMADAQGETAGNRDDETLPGGSLDDDAPARAPPCDCDDDEPSTSRGAEAGANSTRGTEREATNAQATTAPADGGARERDERGKGGGTSPRGRASKKPRLVWTPELHMRFMNAVNHLGIKNAVPKTILQLMNVEGMTRENVASHLQKYRLYLKRVAGIPPNAPLPADIMQRVAPYQFPAGGLAGAAVPFMPTIEQMHAGVAPTPAPMPMPSPAVPFPSFPGAPYAPMSVSDPFAAHHAAAAATMRAQGYAAAMGVGGAPPPPPGFGDFLGYVQGLRPGVEAAGNGATAAATTAAATTAAATAASRQFGAVGSPGDPFAGYLQAAMLSSTMAPGWMTHGGAPLGASTSVAAPTSTEEKKEP